MKKSNDYLIAYVDGSYNNSNNRYGSGVVILDGESNLIIQRISKGGNNGDWAKLQNVAGEVYAAMLAVQYAINQGCKHLTIYHDYKGIAAWCEHTWRAKNPSTAAYVLFMDKVKEKIEIDFQWTKGHSGNTYHDLADELAKDGTKGV